MFSNSQKSSNSGNVLFLILISVALFAALSYAVTSSSRSSGDNVSEEKLDLEFNLLMQYGTVLENAIIRLLLSNGCDETDISFSVAGIATGIPDVYAHSPAVSDECKVFHQDGGAVSIPAHTATELINVISYSPAQYLDWLFKVLAIENVGSGKHGLVAFVNVTQELCEHINDKLGIAGGSPPAIVSYNTLNFKGDYNDSYVGTGYTVRTAAYVGNYSFCAQHGVVGRYAYHHVIRVR